MLHNINKTRSSLFPYDARCRTVEGFTNKLLPPYHTTMPIRNRRLLGLNNRPVLYCGARHRSEHGRAEHVGAMGRLYTIRAG